MTDKEIAFDNTILRGVVGSTAYGTSLDGQGDRDEMGVFIEPPEYVCGLKPIESCVYRDKSEGVRSGPGDLDLTLYSLRKFCKLAAQGNPSILALLWLPEYLVTTPYGRSLVFMREEFISQNAGKRFLGYLVSQKKALMGERSKTVTRPELVEKYGYDTKFAMHAVRLGVQGVELLTERSISLPIREPDRSVLLDIRQGRMKLEEVFELIDHVENDLKYHVERCDTHVDLDKINSFLVSSHLNYWQFEGPVE